MPDLAELNLVIDSKDVGQANNQLKIFIEVGNKAEKQSEGLERSWKGSSNAAGELLSLVGKLALALGGIATINKSLDLAAEWEASTTSLKYLVGDLEEAKRLMQEFDDLGDSTPFSSGAFERSAKNLIAMNYNAKEVVNTLRIAADAAAATGEGEAGLEGISRALATIASRGDLAGQGLRQLAAANIPVFKMLADAIGVTTEEAKELASRNLIEADDAVRIILDGLKRRYGGASKEMSEQTKGLWHQLAEAGESSLRKIGQEIENAFDLDSGLKDYIEGVKHFGQVLADTIAILGGADAATLKTGQSAKVLVEILENVAIVLGAIIALKFAYALGEWAMGLGEAVKSAQAFLSVLTLGLGIIAAIAAALTAFEFGRYLYDEFKIVQQAAAAFFNVVMDGWEYIKFGANAAASFIGYVWDQMIEGLKQAWAVFIRTIATAVQTLDDAGEAVGMGAGGFGNDLEAYARRLEGRGGTPIKSLADRVAEDNKALEAGLAYNKQILDATNKNIESEFGGKDRKGNSFSDFAGADIAAIVDGVKSKLADIRTALFGEFTPAVKKAGEEAKNATDAAAEGTKKAGDEFSKYRGLIKNGIEEMIEKQRIENDLINQTTLARELAVATAKAEDIATKENIKNKDELIKRLREEIQIGAQKKQQADFDKTIKQLQDDRSLIGLSEKERNIQKEMLDQRRQYAESGVALSKEQEAALESNLRANADLEESYSSLRDMAEQAGGELSNFLEGIIFEGKSAKDAIEDLIKSIEKMIVMKLISNAISKGIDYAFAGGGEGGAPPARAGGGDVTGGMSYWVGERGPELFTPARGGHITPNGQSGSGGGTTIVMNVTTRDADSFRRSSLAIQNDLRRVGRR